MSKIGERMNSNYTPTREELIEWAKQGKIPYTVEEITTRIEKGEVKVRENPWFFFRFEL